MMVLPQCVFCKSLKDASYSLQTCRISLPFPLDLPYPKREEFDPRGLEQLGCGSRVAAVRVAVRNEENGFRRGRTAELRDMNNISIIKGLVVSNDHRIGIAFSLSRCDPGCDINIVEPNHFNT